MQCYAAGMAASGLPLRAGCIAFLQGTWVENGTEEGLPSAAVRELYEDQRGGIWAATTRGISLTIKMATLTLPIPTSRVGERREEYPRGQAQLRSHLAARINGNYTPRGASLFFTGFDDREWSTFSDAREVSFTDLSAGKHYFQRARWTATATSTPNRLNSSFSVVLPWFKETRLVLILVAGLSVVYFFAGLAFNRHRRLVRSYAEVERKGRSTHPGARNRKS